MAATCGHARADKKTMLGLRSDTLTTGKCEVTRRIRVVAIANIL